MNDRTDCMADQEVERRGNVWSGVVAMVLLAMFAIALISSEIEAPVAAFPVRLHRSVAGHATAPQSPWQPAHGPAHP